MKKLLLLQLLFIGILAANDRNLSFSLKGSFTTSTRFLYNIDRVNSYGEERTISSNFGYGADVRWNIMWDRFFLGFSIEKVSSHDEVPVFYMESEIPIPFEEGFNLTAMELSGYYVVPISSENIKFYLGGGFGTYDGDRDFSIANVRAATVASKSYIGIHVLTGIDYQLFPRLGLRFEIKFRDPHFDVTTKFDQRSVNYQGEQVQLPQGEYVTKINLFGVNYTGGLVFTL